MRVAFLTNEYPTETAARGGLATYVARMSRLLGEAGHEPEVFVVSEVDETLRHEGVTVHRVDPARARGATQAALEAGARLSGSFALKELSRWTAQARTLADALERRHRQSPFDLVQSADFNAPGLFVARAPGRVHAVRCSSAADLYDAADGPMTATMKLRGLTERMCLRRADVAYAPSRYVADHLRSRFGIPVEVVRPPSAPPTPPGTTERALPARYLVHFGQLMPRKGTSFLAEALPLAWAEAPDLRMVWSGVCWKPQLIEDWRRSFGPFADRVTITGPLDRRELAAVVAGAEAAVLPSQVDNLPNTVIESLSAGVPVIGSRGASIDEIVEDGVTGMLVPFGDAAALAAAMVQAWRGASPVRKGFTWRGGLRDEMEPGVAIERLLGLAKRKG